MEKLYSIKESTLQGLANAIRDVNGETKSYTPEEMIAKVTTIMDSITYLLVDENGVEIPAVFVENETIFTAEANDIRLGKVAANQNGVVEGTKDIPAYYTEQGFEVISPGNQLDIQLFSDMYDYMNLQAIVCEYNTDVTNSVAAKMVVIKDNVYAVDSTTALSTVSKDATTQSIKLGINNDGEKSLVLRYVIIKEE